VSSIEDIEFLKLKNKLKQLVKKYGYNEVRKNLEAFLLINKLIDGDKKERFKFSLMLELLKELKDEVIE